jgi:antitoxin HicB
MGIRPQEVTRLLSLRHGTKIDTVAAAVAALGVELDLTVRGTP